MPANQQPEQKGPVNADLRSRHGDSAPEIETSAECVVRVDNNELRHNVSRVQLDQYIDNHHELRVTVKQVGSESDSEGFIDPGAFSSFLGKSISVTITPTGGLVDASRALDFIGLVTRIDLANSIDGMNTVVIFANSPTIALDGARRNAFYHEQNAGDIIGAILRNYPLTLGSTETADGDLKYCVQYRETDYDFIMRLAGDSGLFAFYNGQEFRVVKPAAADTEDLLWRETLGSFTMKLGTAQPEFTAQVYNYEQKKMYQQDTGSLASEASLSQLSQVAPDASKEVFKNTGFSSSPKVVADAQSLDAILKRERNRSMGRMITCHGRSIVPKVAVGHSVRISGMGALEGQYLIRRIHHLLDESGRYSNTFECTPLDIAYPQQRSAREKVTNLQSAEVLDNNDPDKLGRVKVKFPWLESEETIWVRVLTPHAGPDRGWYSLPEIGDEVLVGYEFGSPDYPIALGALYNKEGAPPSAAPDPENNVKLFSTKSGNQIIIKDESGSEEIAISTKDGENKIVMAMSGPTITIESKGDINLKGKNISFESEQEFTMKSGANMKVEAGANLESKASANFNAEGAMVALKGQGPVDIKGAVIKLN
jgi:Rhs element Vgr protein